MALHENYATLTPTETDAVDMAIDAAMRVFRKEGFQVACDDRAERLADALAIYLKAHD